MSPACRPWTETFPPTVLLLNPKRALQLAWDLYTNVLDPQTEPKEETRGGTRWSRSQKNRIGRGAGLRWPQGRLTWSAGIVRAAFLQPSALVPKTPAQRLSFPQVDVCGDRAMPENHRAMPENQLTSGNEFDPGRLLGALRALRRGD